MQKKIIDTILTKNDIYSILTRKIEKGKEKFLAIHIWA